MVESDGNGKTQTRVLLCIDEIMKVSQDKEDKTNFENVDEVYRQLTTALDSTFFVWALVTSLDYTPFFRIQSDSGRMMHWIPLPPAKLQTALTLFEKFCNPSNEYFRLKGDFTHSDLKAAIAFCSGHFRSLMYLHQYLKWHSPNSLADCLEGMEIQYIPEFEVLLRCVSFLKTSTVNDG